MTANPGHCCLAAAIAADCAKRDQLRRHRIDPVDERQARAVVLQNPLEHRHADQDRDHPLCVRS
jgi:hypothetical protein